jgi:DNA-nicking Smr family endonuclease
MTDDSDKHIFASAMKGVIPLAKTKGDDRVSQTDSKKPKPIPRFSRQAESDLAADMPNANAADIEIDAGDDLRFARDGVQPMVLRKLRRGDYPIQDQIDLHGMNALEARRYVDDFLDYAASEGYRAVRIVHGKGNHSQQGPILKRHIGVWLRKRNNVLAYVSAQQADGGTGALYVLLAR